MLLRSPPLPFWRRMLGRVSPFVSAAVLAACASSATVTPIDGPNRELWWTVECHGARANCWKAAIATCPWGYDDMDGEGHVGGVTAVQAGRYTFARSRYEGEMLIRCRPPSAAQ